MDISDIKDAHELLPSLWVEGMKNESGFPIEFKNHRFMIDIYNDLSPFQVILKPPQIGATVMNVLKALWVASHMGKQIIYTLPTATDMYEMVSSGFNRIIAQNPELMELVSINDTMDHKQVGDGLIRFRGTFSAKQAMMVPSDLNIHDEVDASDPNVITQYETRLQAKANGWRWYFSHPSLAGRGVDVYWRQSDKKEWMVSCESCGHKQCLTWPTSVDTIRQSYICKECKQSISDYTRRNGAWEATGTGQFSGYHVSQLMCPWISAEKIIDAYNDQTKTKQYFYNYVLGLPYADSQDIITKEQVLANVTDDFNAQEDRVFIGVDTGLPIWVVLMNKDGVFHTKYLGEPSANYDPYKELEAYLLRWPQSILVSDQGGDLIGIRQLQAKYPGRVYLGFYRKDRKTSEIVKWEHEKQEVIIDRNKMISLMVDQMREGNRIKLNGSKEEFDLFANHFTNMYRTIVDSPTGPQYVWERRGPDHLAHAMLYAMVAYEHWHNEPDAFATPDWMNGLKTGRMFTQ